MTNPYAGSGGPPSFSSTSAGPGGDRHLRRPSYATVAAGTGTASHRASASERSAVASAGALALAARGEQQPQAVNMLSRPHSRSIDMGEQGGQRPGSGWRGNRMGCLVHEDHPPFFIPSYLGRSRHVARLYREHRRHLEELQELARQEPIPPPQPSLSTSSSNVNLHKLHTAHTHHHRGPVQDIIERLPPPSEEDKNHPLPSAWSEEDKQSGLEIQSEGTEVRFTGNCKTSDEAASIRSDHPMPKECGIYYYEITILSRGKDGMIGIGFSTKRASLNRLPGWEQESWAYHGDDGYCFACTASGKAYGPRFASNDVIGCGINFRTGEAFFTKNGVYLGVAFNNIKGDKLYPSVGMKKPNEHLRVNFGRTPFVFDIDRMMEQGRRVVMAEIRQTDVTPIYPSGDESALTQALVAQYLAHEGYVETAKALSRESWERQESIRDDSQPYQPPDSDDDVHAINRQKIRKSILDGDIDRALKYTSSYYPNVLEEGHNRDVYFRLKCRKFIEMMRRYAELVAATSSPRLVTKSIDSLASNGHAEQNTEDGQNGEPEDDEDDDDTQMELDDQLHRETTTTKKPSAVATDDIDMDASQELTRSQTLRKGAFMKKEDLQAAALAYGRELQMEFGSSGDVRPEIKKELQDLGAIWAYDNPADSPIAGMLDKGRRALIAEEVNGAILVSLGKPSSAALETLCAQTEALLDDTANKGGGAAAFVQVFGDLLAA
ncbi:hypothetical protein LTR86_007022 [Recurvomyces mirabilis]|nr:hypothetical protein LTR86_007022 [Recurvomyces mirabilis]